MTDATIVTEQPPLRACYAPVGHQVTVPVTGSHARRVLFGALNITTGHLECLITDTWEAVTWQVFLQQIRRTWRGWRISLFLDRGSPHTAAASRQLARQLGMQLRWLPTATPELNALEGLWRHGKAQRLANRTTDTVDTAVEHLAQYLLDLAPRQRLQTAGVCSGRFWLTR